MHVPGALRAPTHRLLLLPILLLGACAAPAARPLDGGGLARAVGARGVDPVHLAQALEAARLEPLSLPLPGADFDPTRIDVDRPEPWHASAFAFEARARAARHALAAARHGARSAGTPSPVRAMVEVEELERPDAYARMTLSFDLLGILGLGPAAAARELADVQVARALAELESAVWDARIEVDRARARLASLRARRAALEELAQDAARAQARLTILERTGRLAPQALAAARSAERRLALGLLMLEGEEAMARAELAVAAGIAPESPWLDALGPATLDGVGLLERPEPPARTELLARSPELRAGLVDYALAEARLRQASAARWPSFELGPHLLWTADELMTGIIAGTMIPWPGSLDGALRAALEEREAARSALEDALLASEARARAAHGRWAAARAGFGQHAARLEEDSATAWRAAQARFDVEPGSLMEWAGSLGMRVEALNEYHAARLAAIEAALDLEWASGPSPRAWESGLARAGVRP